MQLDNVTIENLLINLSKFKFNGICRVILKEIFLLDTVNVDGRGDGGGDWITIPYGGGKRAFVAQATVQEKNWKSKCIDDADKAVNKLGCNKYIFLTSRRHGSADLRWVENEIENRFDIPASCLGAVEIADTLVSRKLVSKAFTKAGMDLSVSFNERPDRSEQLVFSSLSLSSGATTLRNEIQDEAILYVLSSKGSMGRDELAAAVIETLQCGNHREGRVNSRIDSLLTRGALEKDNVNQKLNLSKSTLESLQQAKAIYEEQFSDLSEKINSIIVNSGLSVADATTLISISTFASRAMIVGTIKSAEKAGVNIHNTFLLEQLGEPQESLKKILSTLTTEKKTIDNIVPIIITVTHEHPLVIRLAQELIHFAIDGINPAHHVRALGVSDWNETETLLDASVAIPYLCSQITQPSKGRFSRGAIASVEALKMAGSSLFIPRDYLHEAAVHLLHAVDYCRLKEDPELFASSKNGYVSHYFSLKRDGANVPARLIEFLVLLAPSLRSVNEKIVTQISNDLETLFIDFGVSRINFGHIHSSYTDSINMAFQEHLDEKHSREKILIEHDVNTLAWMKYCRARGHNGKLCLTWDELMISVARDDENSGWAVTPHQASDLISVGSQRDDRALLSVVHELASTRTAHEDLFGKLLDDVISFAREGILKWEVINMLSDLRKQVHERALNEGAPGDEELQSIAADFWKQLGIDINASHERSNVTQKEIDEALGQAKQ